MMKYPKILVAAMLLVGGMAANAETKTIRIWLANTLNVKRSDVPVVISLKDIPFNVVDAVVKDGDREVPSQIDDLDRNLRNDELAFVIDVEAKGKKTLTVELYSDKQTERNYPRRTYGDMIVRDFKTKKKNKFPGYIHSLSAPEGVDVFHLLHHHGADFESELVAYRVYFDERQTYDLYGKYNKQLELQTSQFYPDDEQLAAGYGDDVLWAGQTVGLGALRGWDGQKPTMVSPVKSRGQRMVASGPVRTIVELTDEGWQLGGQTFNLRQNVIIYAGHRDCEVQVYQDTPAEGVQFATGVINLNEKMYSDHKGLVGDWGGNWPNGAKDSIAGKPKIVVGLAVNVPEKYVISEPANQKDQFLYTLGMKGSDRLTYNMAFTCDKETFGFKDAKEWFAWMKQWKKELDNPVRVTVEW
ncbi:DUF4861 domain-containing protein [uncultured Prevotella sp.]|uniref:DUF4861 domain-containing protein n=1 Tax=uncultured Prevotella sp. TaxID=159272 RepID=UPI002607F894|nr:DUF4861 domain-containing protein [uncultured Prevotella sp.]